MTPKNPTRFQIKRALQHLAAIGALSVVPVMQLHAQDHSHDGPTFSFPAEENGFRRQNADDSELTGIFARADYLKKTGDQEISVKIDIVHLLEMSPTEHFAIRKANLSNEYPTIELKQEGEYKIKNLPPKSGYFGHFEAKTPQGVEAFGVFTFDLGDWDIYVKARYPAARRARAQREITQLLSAMDWAKLQKMHVDDKID